MQTVAALAMLALTTIGCAQAGERAESWADVCDEKGYLGEKEGTRHVRLVLDPSLTDEQVAGFEHAARSWNRSGRGVSVQVTMSGRPQHGDGDVNVTACGEQSRWYQNVYADSGYYPEGSARARSQTSAIVILKDKLENETNLGYLHNLAAHEIGHVLGCEHDDDPAAVMSGTALTSDEMTLTTPFSY